MTPSAKIDRPKLAGHARYRWDRVRRQHQLVFPEGMLVLNDTGAEIARRCDGNRSVSELTAELEECFNDCRADDVNDFIRRLEQRGLLCHGT